jgi:hypothetical protein
MTSAWNVGHGITIQNSMCGRTVTRMTTIGYQGRLWNRW